MSMRMRGQGSGVQMTGRVRCRVYDVDVRIWVQSEAIHATEALGHAVERREIANEVIRRDVHADFAGTGANEVDGARLGFDFPTLAFGGILLGSL